MKTSAPGIELIKAFEGIRDGDPSTVNLDPYLCPANVATIGWGHAVLDSKGRMLRGREGLDYARRLFPDGITLAMAEELLKADLAEREPDVEGLIQVDVTQGQFDALMSFAFNVGTDIDADLVAEGLGDSTLLKKLNAGNYTGAADEFLKWNKSGGQVLVGLTRRRQAERAMFLGRVA
jgi:lysozyme